VLEETSNMSLRSCLPNLCQKDGEDAVARNPENDSIVFRDAVAEGREMTVARDPKDDSDVFHDAVEGSQRAWLGRRFMSTSSVYFDAEQFQYVAAYPPIISSIAPKHQMVRFSLETPDTLLRPTEEETFQDEEMSERRVSLLKERSVRMGAGQFSKARKATILIRQELEAPGVSILEKGFPGQLTQKEVDQVVSDTHIFRGTHVINRHVYSSLVMLIIICI